MEFEKLISVSGKGSLFKIVSRTNFGLIAESLEDGKRLPVYQSNNVSTLTDISIYTNEGDVSLKTVLLKIYEKESGKETSAVTGKDDAVRKYFGEILPDFDQERVYTSDIKKLLKWYNQLIKNNIDPEQLKDKEEAEETEQEETKKATKSKAKAKDEDASTEKEKKPAVKKEKTDAAKKKTTAAKTNKPAPKVTNAPAKKVQTVRKAGG